MAGRPYIDQAIIDAFTRRRVAAGMTQASVAAAVNAIGLGLAWTRTHVASLEAGRRRSLRMVEIVALCSVHDVTLADLFREADVDPEQTVTLLGPALSDAELHTELTALRRRIRAAQDALEP